jgi:hypothetical protein
VLLLVWILSTPKVEATPVSHTSNTTQQCGLDGDRIHQDKQFSCLHFKVPSELAVRFNQVSVFSTRNEFFLHTTDSVKLSKSVLRGRPSRLFHTQNGHTCSFTGRLNCIIMHYNFKRCANLNIASLACPLISLPAMLFVVDCIFSKN